MSDDLISRKALKKKIEEVQYTQEFCIEHHIDYSISMQMLGMVIDNAPTVEAYTEQITIKCDTEEDRQELLSALRNARVNAIVEEERPQGEWLDIYKSHIAYECSCCGLQTPVPDYYHFCPNCGAEMKGGRE